MELIIYLLMLTLMCVFAVLAYRFWSVLGVFGGLLGAIFTYMSLTDTVLVINTAWSETQQAFVSSSVDMGFFAYVPLILTALNIVVALKK
jgi:hypothetical protein